MHLQATHITSEGRLLAGLLTAFVVVAVVAGVDVGWDLREGTTAGHVLAEGGVLLVGLLGSVVVARQLVLVLRAARAAQQEAHVAQQEARILQEEARTLAERLAVTEAEASRWRAEARDLLNGLGAALDQQFERWALSPAEKEVALLLLKGLSHKELAEVRSITEATARQQSRAVYKKSGLSGRADLAAFFLEDLLLPRHPEPRPGAAQPPPASPQNTPRSASSP